jgi:hypothetical protein
VLNEAAGENVGYYLLLEKNGTVLDSKRKLHYVSWEGSENIYN